MSRSLQLTLLIFLLISNHSYGQKVKRKESPLVITYFGDKNPFRDSVFLSDIARTYGANAAIIVDSLRKNTTYMKGLDSSFSKKTGEFLSSSYKIHLPIPYLNYTSDYDHIFTKDQIAVLDSIINRFRDETSITIAIVSIDSAWTTKANFNDLIETIHYSWGDENKNISNGIVIGISKEHRIIRIDNGSGVTQKLTDKETKKIIYEVIIPKYKQGAYFSGTKSGLLAIMQSLR